MALEMNMQIKLEVNFDASAVENDLKNVVLVAARNIEKKAKRVVPVDTGATKNSIFVDPGSPDLAQRIGPTTHYSPFIEYGTRYWVGVPFMVPSIESERPLLERAITQVLQRMQRG